MKVKVGVERNVRVVEIMVCKYKSGMQRLTMHEKRMSKKRTRIEIESSMQHACRGGRNKKNNDRSSAMRGKEGEHVESR